MQAADDDSLRIILQKQYGRNGCRACKSDTHTYHNCTKRPCYLCKKKGHVTANCPFRSTPEAIAAQRASLQKMRRPETHPYGFLKRRELSSDPIPFPLIPSHAPYASARVSYIASRSHGKRITAAEWHPTGQFVLSGDKEGTVRVWPVQDAISRRSFLPEKATGDSVMLAPHRCNVTSLTFDKASSHMMYASSSDGTVTASDIGVASRNPANSIADLLYDFNPNGHHGSSSWLMAYGLSYDESRRCLYVGSNKGTIVRIDPRSKAPSESLLVRARFHSGKVTTIDVNPTRSDLIATASNDYTVRLWDARKMVPNQYLGQFLHDRIVSSAYFSPFTGGKLLTTSQDNRIRVWDDLHSFHGNVNSFPDAQPVEFVHSHDFQRYLSPFRATWDPNDWSEDLFLCGRFLSEAYRESEDSAVQLLHPVDLFSVRAQCVVSSLVDSSMALRCTINKFCPVADAILTAASGNLYVWSAPPGRERDDNDADRRKGGDHHRDGRERRGDDDDGNDDDDNHGGNSGGRRNITKKRKFNATTVSRKSARSFTGRRAARDV